MGLSMIQPDFHEFQRLAKQGNLIPVYDVFSADLLTPVSAYLRMAQGARYSFLLESVEGGEKIARYTFAGAHPEEVFRYGNGACVFENRERLVWEERDPISFLRERVERFPVTVRALIEAERFGPQRPVNGVSLLLVHGSSWISGNENGLAGQLPGRGLVVDGGQIG